MRYVAFGPLLPAGLVRWVVALGWWLALGWPLRRSLRSALGGGLGAGSAQAEAPPTRPRRPKPPRPRQGRPHCLTKPPPDARPHR